MFGFWALESFLFQICFPLNELGQGRYWSRPTIFDLFSTMFLGMSSIICILVCTSQVHLWFNYEMVFLFLLCESFDFSSRTLYVCVHMHMQKLCMCEFVCIGLYMGMHSFVLKLCCCVWVFLFCFLYCVCVSVWKRYRLWARDSDYSFYQNSVHLSPFNQDRWQIS